MTVHFVGFRDVRIDKDERYERAVKVYGTPDFVHRVWDVRAWQEIQPDDVIVFAKGDESYRLTPYTFDDSAVL